MNFKNIKKFLKKNYKKIIVVCLIMLLFSNKMYENFSTTQALDAVKSTETKVNNMATKVGADYVDLKSGIRLSKNWKNGATATNSEISNDIGHYKKLMVIGNKSSGTRKVGIWDHLDVHGNQNVTGNSSANKFESRGDVNGKRFCIDGVCINKTHLEMLTGKRHHFISNWKKNRFMKQEGNEDSWKLEFKEDWADEKKRLFFHNINGEIPY
jgi:hypothetical protein